MTEITNTSSIGAVWPPDPGADYARVKGFYTECVIDNVDAVSTFAKQFRTHQDNMNGQTRLTIRAVTTAVMLRGLWEQGVPVEAAIPLAGDHDGLIIAYTGWNAPDRTITDEELAAYQIRLDALAIPSSIQEDPAEELTARGYGFGYIDTATSDEEREAFTEQFSRLYSTFGYTTDSTRDMLKERNRRIAYVTHGDEIVSTAMAEIGEITVEGLAGEIAVAEITEASTDPRYERKGLYSLISRLLVQRLLEEDGLQLHAIYGESRLDVEGVVRAAHTNGRLFSRNDGDRFGIDNPAFGILPRNVAVGGELRNFAVTYIPPDMLVR